MLGTVGNKISVAPLQILPRFKKAKNCVLGFPRGGVLGIPRTYWQSTLGPWFSKESLDFQWDVSPWIFKEVLCDRSVDFQGVPCDRSLDFQAVYWPLSHWISKDIENWWWCTGVAWNVGGLGGVGQDVGWNAGLHCRLQAGLGWRAVGQWYQQPLLPRDSETS